MKKILLDKERSDTRFYEDPVTWSKQLNIEPPDYIAELKGGWLILTWVDTDGNFTHKFIREKNRKGQQIPGIMLFPTLSVIGDQRHQTVLAAGLIEKLKIIAGIAQKQS